ncbi:PaaI family thioesterase [Oscillibacter sp.]|uniref:PaaI family thioesterase n=1 Tax=Oscillibacter sp. TaxID=1945593 RepID=UPI0026040B32|nr:PaaI family thioesterase [Oscillibacter sp.]MDD3346281.1 PaaI family thioesterase [Oscillibacter sp.]
MDYEKLAEYRNAKNFFCRHLGIRVTEISHGYAKTVKTVSQEDLNPVGVPHGGVYFSMADTACGSAVSSEGFAVVTVDSNYHFLRSAKPGDTLTAEAREVKSGRTLCVCDVRVTNQEDALLGIGTFTFYRLDEKLNF